MLEARMGENGQQAAPEVRMRNWNGVEGTSIPQSLYERLKTKVGAPRSGLQDGNTQICPGAAQRGEGGRRKHKLPTCCVYSRVIPPRIRFCLKPEEGQCAPGTAANWGRGGKPGCLWLPTAPGLRAEVRMLQIPTAAVCLQDLRNQTKQLKRNPVV